jgi:pyruvate,water dikinase
MHSWLNIFPGTRQKQNIDSLRLKIERFRNLLGENNRALDLLADAEEKLGGDFLFDIQYIRSLARELEDSIGKVVLDLNFITGNRYVSLNDAFEKIRARVNDVLASKIIIPDTPYVLTLEEINWDVVNAAGEKMANLGEIKKRLNYNVPDGFVITSHACKMFFDKIKLTDQIGAMPDASGAENLTAKDVHIKLGGLISDADVPGNIKKAIRQAASSLEKKMGKKILFAVRSSALGEDGELSFAGLHETFLGVKSSELLSAYKGVVASLFSPRAVAYRRSRGEALSWAVMAVGCLQVIPAISSGVVYTLDPNAPEGDIMIVTATPGLGKLVVEGEASVDRFMVSRSFPHRVVSREVPEKDKMYEIHPEGGIHLVPVPASRKSVPSVSDEFLSALASAALRIERYKKTPQDIEWAQDENGDFVVLQTRPLQIQADSTNISRKLSKAVKRHKILISDHGTVTCRGIGYGRVVKVTDGEMFKNVQEGAVLVAHHSSPHLAELVPRASAVITDIGAPTGHLATVTRELRVPSIMDVGIATRVLKDDMEVTVDAEENIVYEGKVEELLLYQLLKKSSYEDTLEFRLLRRLLKNIAPLNLRNPQSENFSPRHCETYHDITRFAHEMAVEYLMERQKGGWKKSSPYCKKVIMNVPLDLMVIDISGGELLKSCGIECRINEIDCEPLRVLLEGISAPGAWSSEPAEMDFDSFMSSVTRPSVMTQVRTRVPERNLAIVSEQYLNLNLHLGYHLNQVDAYVSDARNDNYIYFRFIGGVTNITRRSRRAKMISIILERHDFVVETLGDFIVARLKKLERQIMLERLKMIGYLIGFTRQMDVQMRNDSMIKKGVDQFAESIYDN